MISTNLVPTLDECNAINTPPCTCTAAKRAVHAYRPALGLLAGLAVAGCAVAMTRLRGGRPRGAELAATAS